MKVTKKAYTELIQQDLEFLNKYLSKMDNSLELNHIKAVLTASIDRFYETDASRWRKVSNELPKVASKPYCIVVRSDDGRIQLEWILEGYDECVISFLLDKYIEWKPIEL